MHIPSIAGKWRIELYVWSDKWWLAGFSGMGFFGDWLVTAAAMAFPVWLDEGSLTSLDMVAVVGFGIDGWMNWFINEWIHLQMDFDAGNHFGDWWLADDVQLLFRILV